LSNLLQVHIIMFIWGSAILIPFGTISPEYLTITYEGHYTNSNKSSQ
jgi:hypothetical protein